MLEIDPEECPSIEYKVRPRRRDRAAPQPAKGPALRSPAAALHCPPRRRAQGIFNPNPHPRPSAPPPTPLQAVLKSGESVVWEGGANNAAQLGPGPAALSLYHEFRQAEW